MLKTLRVRYCKVKQITQNSANDNGDDAEDEDDDHEDDDDDNEDDGDNDDDNEEDVGQSQVWQVGTDLTNTDVILSQI